MQINLLIDYADDILTRISQNGPLKVLQGVDDMLTDYVWQLLISLGGR